VQLQFLCSAIYPDRDGSYETLWPAGRENKVFVMGCVPMCDVIANVHKPPLPLAGFRGGAAFLRQVGKIKFWCISVGCGRSNFLDAALINSFALTPPVASSFFDSARMKFITVFALSYFPLSFYATGCIWDAYVPVIHFLTVFLIGLGSNRDL
jgi:hypothetical protein